MVRTTPWKEFTDKNQKYRIKVTYGMDYNFARRNSQAPYFSATASIERLVNGFWREDSAGMQHDEIAKHFPQLAQYLKWHLVSTEEPLHYIANAKYWWEAAMGKTTHEGSAVNPKDAFASTILFGAVPGDKMPYSNDWQDVEKWLKARLPKMMGFFLADMKALGVLE